MPRKRPVAPSSHPWPLGMARDGDPSAPGGSSMISENNNTVTPKTATRKKPPSSKLRRAIDALAMRFPNGSVKREELDRICGSTNSPDIILKLRKDYVGDDGVICQIVNGIDCDGRPHKSGQYSFSQAGFQHIHEQGLHNGEWS